MSAEAVRLTGLRERLREGIVGQLDQVGLNGHPTLRLPGNLNLSFARIEGEALMVGMKDIAVSSGSACTSAKPEPSYVLKALGRSDEEARGSIRFGLGRFNTAQEVDCVIGEVVRVVRHLRSLNPTV
jgi:cysteine desulfurase